MACRYVLDDSSDFSEDQGDRSTETDDSTGGYDMDIIHIGDVLNYTIPTFNVITVKVQHGVTRFGMKAKEKLFSMTSS